MHKEARMKSLLKVLLSINTALLLCACVDTGIDGAVTLGGKIDGGTDSHIVILKQPETLPAFYGETPLVVDTITTDAKGLFLSGSLYDSGMYLFDYQNINFPLYLLPEKTLNINIDVNDPENTLEFSGALKHPNRLIRDQNKKAGQIAHELQNRDFKKDDQFMRFIDSSRKSLDTLVVRFITNHPRTDKSFMQDRQQFNYYFTGNLILSRASQLKQNGDTLSSHLQAALESFALNRDELIQHAEYLKFARRKLEFHLESDRPEHLTQAIDSLIPGIKTKSAVALKYARNIIIESDSMPGAQIINAFNGVITDAEIRNTFNGMLEQAASISPGTSFSGFSGMDETESVRSTDEFKGSPVLLYFGTALCPQCRYEFEQLQTLPEQAGDTTLQLLGIGLKTGFTEWKKHIERANYPGTQLYLNQNANEVYRKFMITDEPHYMLISADGRILSRNLTGDLPKKVKALLAEKPL